MRGKKRTPIETKRNSQGMGKGVQQFKESPAQQINTKKVEK
jgi:hypothetical protein